MFQSIVLFLIFCGIIALYSHIQVTAPGVLLVVSSLGITALFSLGPGMECVM